jgi:hypothetical protein
MLQVGFCPSIDGESLKLSKSMRCGEPATNDTVI